MVFDEGLEPDMEIIASEDNSNSIFQGALPSLKLNAKLNKK
jgi:hypothetical protein